MKKEIVACIEDKNIKFLHSGQISKYIFPLEREEAHLKNVSHLIIRLFIMAMLPNNEILYLIQKRSKKKKTFPEYFTDSASGHILYKKNLNLNDILENVRRELEEEFGISQKEIGNILLYDLKAEENQQLQAKEVAYVFIGLVSHNVSLNPNPEELEIYDSRFYPKSELLTLLEKEKAIDYSKQIWMKLINTDVISLFEKDKTIWKNNSKKQEIALFIGRFQPLHHGHIYVINSILKKYRKIKIGIGSSQLSQTFTDPFTSDERIQFLFNALQVRNISPNRFKIYEIPDIFNANKWVDHIVSIVGKFNVVFSNSEWVRQLFQNKGYEVGKKLEIFKKKYNATRIRKLITRSDNSWKRLVPKEVVALIIEYNGLERIKTLYEKENLL